MSVVGMNSGGACQADNGVAMDADEAPVWRMPLPSAKWSRTETAVGSGRWQRYSGVPSRSEKRARQALQ